MLYSEDNTTQHDLDSHPAKASQQRWRERAYRGLCGPSARPRRPSASPGSPSPRDGRVDTPSVWEALAPALQLLAASGQLSVHTGISLLFI